MAFEPFKREYGVPQQDTAVDLERLRLGHSAGLRQIVSEVGGGTFAGGFLSLVSVRECVEDLGGWEAWLPTGSRLFGCSAFGFLMTTRGEDVWVIDTQYGEVVESDQTIQRFIETLATPGSRDEILRKPLFDLWNEMVGGVPPSSVLCPTPAIPLGGTWTVTSLSVMSLPVYLSFTGQMFSPDGGMPAEVRRLS